MCRCTTRRTENSWIVALGARVTKRVWVFKLAATIVMSLGAVASETVGRAKASPAGRVDSAPNRPVTFAKDVAPIIFDRCGTCHHSDGAAPFSLLTYAGARQHATQIAALTKNRVMPPWKSEPGYGEFIGHRALSDGEIGLLQRWVADG